MNRRGFFRILPAAALIAAGVAAARAEQAGVEQRPALGAPAPDPAAAPPVMTTTTLKWTHNDEDAADVLYYEVKADGHTIAMLPPDRRSFTASGIIGATRSFWIEAVYPDGREVL